MMKSTLNESGNSRYRFSKEDEKSIITFIYQQYKKFVQRQAIYMSNSKTFNNLKMSEDLQHVTPASIIDSNLYSFKYFKKYIIEKFGYKDPIIAHCVKSTLSAIESLRAKKQKSEQYSHLDNETLISMDGDVTKSDVALEMVMTKYHKINAVTESNKANRQSLIMKL